VGWIRCDAPPCCANRVEGAHAALKGFGHIAKSNKTGGKIRKPGSVFAEADATSSCSPSLGAQAPVLAAQHLLPHPMQQGCHQPSCTKVPARAALGVLLQLLKQVQNSSQGPSRKLGFKVKVGWNPNSPSVPHIRARVRVPSCPPPATCIPAGEGLVLASAGLFGPALLGLGIVSVIWLAVCNAISHGGNVSSA